MKAGGKEASERARRVCARERVNIVRLRMGPAIVGGGWYVEDGVWMHFGRG
jgi:hypothetical protein